VKRGFDRGTNRLAEVYRPGKEKKKGNVVCGFGEVNPEGRPEGKGKTRKREIKKSEGGGGARLENDSNSRKKLRIWVEEGCRQTR